VSTCIGFLGCFFKGNPIITELKKYFLIWTILFFGVISEIVCYDERVFIIQATIGKERSGFFIVFFFPLWEKKQKDQEKRMALPNFTASTQRLRLFLT